MWMAGGGVKGGRVLGATDEFGVQATEMRVDAHDVNATILRLLGLDHRVDVSLSGPRHALDGRQGLGRVSRQLVA